MGVIYKVTNTDNGKIYIGKTLATARSRWGQHCSRAKHGIESYFYCAIRKYGRASFTVEVIDHGYSDEELNAKEAQWIQAFQSCDRRKGYNCTTGGDGCAHTESSRLKMKRDPEVSARLGALQRGRKYSAEVRARMSESRTGLKQSPETVAKRVNKAAEKRAKRTPEEVEAFKSSCRAAWTPERRAANAETTRTRWAGATFRSQISKIHEDVPKKVPKTPARPEHAARMKAWWEAHPEARDRMRNRTISEATLRKQSEVMREYWNKVRALEAYRGGEGRNNRSDGEHRVVADVE